LSRSILTPALPFQQATAQTSPSVTEHVSSLGSSYSLQGRGTPLVFIHAVGLNKSIWFAQTSELAHQFQVLTYDIMGHGRSPLPPEHPHLRDYVCQLVELMNELGIYQAHVVGHSLGAMIALELALNHPNRCLSVSALSPVFERSMAQRRAAMSRTLTRSNLGGKAALTATLARWFNHPISDRDLPDALLAQHALDEVDPIGFQRGYELFVQCDTAHADRLSELRVPALFMTGEHDPNSTPKMANTMARLVPGSTVRVLPNGRHMMCLSLAELVNAQLLEFFKAIDDADDICPQALQTLRGRLSRSVAMLSIPGSKPQAEGLHATDLALISRTPLMVMVSISKSTPRFVRMHACEAFTVKLYDPAHPVRHAASTLNDETRPNSIGTGLMAQAHEVPRGGSYGWIDCTLVQILDFGDHAQLIGEVRNLGINPQDLCFSQGGTLSH